MPAKNTKIYISVEPLQYNMLRDIACAEGFSLSALAHDLIREALELREDMALIPLAKEREKTFNPGKSLSHRQVWT